MQISSSPDISLQLLLFVDQRPASRDHIRQIRSLLAELSQSDPYELQIVDVAEQPYLAEHFRLITTPALIKIAPEPRQMLAGSDLMTQLRTAWVRWQQQIPAPQPKAIAPPQTPHSHHSPPLPIPQYRHGTTLPDGGNLPPQTGKSRTPSAAHLQGPADRHAGP